MFSNESNQRVSISRVLAAAVLAGVGAGSALAQAQLDRLGSDTVAVGRSESSCACGDFDGDGRREVVWTTVDQSGRLAVLVYSDPGFGQPQTRIADLRLSTGAYLSSVAAGDFDGDGRDEVAVAIADTANSTTVRVYSLSAGTLKLDASQTLATGNPTLDLAVGDFDGDRRSDLVLTTIDSSQRLAILVHRLSGASLVRFGDVRIAVGNPAHAVSGGDYDGDGRDELAVSSFDQSGRVALMAYSFAGPAPVRFADQRIVVSSSFSTLASGDFDGDQRDEIALTTLDGSSQLALLVYDYAGGSLSRIGDWRLPGISARTEMSAGDLDGNGADEIVFLWDTLVTTFALGQSAPTASYVNSWVVPLVVAGACGVASGDLDADGRDDIAFVHAELGLADMKLLERDEAASVSAGCMGSNGMTPRLTEEQGGHVVRLSQVIPGTSAWLFLWPSRLANPLDLSAFRMPGCTFAVPLYYYVGMSASGADLVAQIDLPNQEWRLYLQAIVYDPMANPAGLVVSNAIDMNYEYRIE